MQTTQTKYTGNDLLHTASGEELLMLMSMSNTAMKVHIRRELDARAALAAVSAQIRRLRPRAGQPAIFGRAA